MATKRSSVFRLDVKSSGPVRQQLLDFVVPIIERISGLAGLRRLYERAPAGGTPDDLLGAVLEDLEVDVTVDEPGLRGIPVTGPVVVVANHPFGAVEGMILGHLLMSRRRDVKILANYFLGRIPELRDLFLPIDPFGSPAAVRTNLTALRRAHRWLDGGGMLATFPAGEVAHLDLRRRRVEDPPWLPSVAHLVRHSRSTVVPIFFPGRNSPLFQLLGLIHTRLRTALLGRELLRRRGATIEVRIGSPIPYRQLASYADEELVAYLRSRTYILGDRPAVAGLPVQPRVTPGSVQPVVCAVPAETLAEEVERLPADRFLVEAGDEAVYVSRAPQIPNLLREIGRQREITFRDVGEGTGREIDLDEFDADYHHLFIWNRAKRELVGAYRLGLTDELLGSGNRGLYTSTLFSFKPRLFEAMGPAIEMGRSFIRPEYQKSYAELVLLWKGIGRFVVRNPRYATLFGPVSISASYRSASQRLIVSFLEQNRFAHDWSRWVRARTPVRPDRAVRCRLSPSQLEDLDDVSRFIAEIEADHKGVPILLKQYLRLGGQLLGFNVDPDFSNVLDVLVMVDLRRTPSKILNRYMGRDGASRFRAHHRRESHHRAS